MDRYNRCFPFRDPRNYYVIGFLFKDYIGFGTNLSVNCLDWRLSGFNLPWKRLSFGKWTIV